MLTVRNKPFRGMRKIVIRNVRKTVITGPLAISPSRNTFFYGMRLGMEGGEGRL